MKKLIVLVAATLLFTAACSDDDDPIAPGTTGSIPMDGLVAYYPFNGNADDESGNGHDGTVQGATLTSDRHGNGKSAYFFDGQDDEIALEGYFGGGTEITVAAWFNVASHTGTFQGIFESNVGTGNPVVHLQVNYGGNNVVYHTRGTVFLPIIKPTPLNVWRHVVVTSKSGETNMYIDNVLVSTSNTEYETLTSNNNLLIGSGYDQRYFHGAIDEVYVYDRALTDNEVAALFTSMN